jgi:ABC-type transporter Mla subunit MlaD
MAIHDLTPQLRTRLGRVERLVGLFVVLATALLLFGFFYYVYHTAERKGWFLLKAPYFTFVRTAAGLALGEQVKMMGFDIGQITKVEAMPADQTEYNVYVEFRIKSPYYGYLWTDSKAKVVTGDFLGHRYLEVTRGTDGKPSYKEETFSLLHFWTKKALLIWDENTYKPLGKKPKGFWLHSEETPALTEQLDLLIKKAEVALPHLTNQLYQILENGTVVMTNLNDLILSARPVVTNLELISAQLRDPHGSFGEWLIPTNLNLQLQQTLSSAKSTLTTANSALTTVETNLSVVVRNLNLSLENLANMTSNLNAQVEANTNILSQLSTAVVNADTFVQGLKRHWLLRSAFKEKKTNAPPAQSALPKRGNRF